jgi:hypothetical protein
MTEEEIAEKVEAAFYAGLGMGIVAARPNWTQQRQQDVFNRLVESQPVPALEIVSDIHADPEFAEWLTTFRKYFASKLEQDRNEIAELEQMLARTDQQPTCPGQEVHSARRD